MDYIKAFAVGGLLCLIGQILMDKTAWTPARILTGYVVTGVILGASGVYRYIADFAGAGASVPLTGFGNLLAEGVKKAVSEDGLIGVLKGGFTAASAGLAAAIFFGLLCALIFRSKDKKR